LPITAIVIVVAGCFAMRSAGAAPAAVADTQAPEFAPAAPPGSTAPSVIADTAAVPEPAADALMVDHLNAAGTAGNWFAASELDPNVLRDKSGMQVAPGACLYPRGDAGGRGGGGDCRLLQAGGDGSTIFTMPMVAILGWVLAIVSVAGGYYLNRYWRTRRWLHQMRSQGIMVQLVNRRGEHPHRASRARSRKLSASRSRAA
jgi:hypothetical protein